MNFDIVIVTRNRLAALQLSLPLLVSQSRLASKIVVVDSSDDPAPVAAYVAALAAAAPRPIVFVRSRPGLAIQRNVGLGHVTEEVVVFPDDDSLCHPGTLEAIMRVYERDTAGQIAGVCATPADRPPPGVDLGVAYAMTEDHARKARTAHLRHRMERMMNNTNPFRHMARRLQRHWPAIPWLAEANCVPVEWMTGFRMSFRTAAIAKFGFETAFKGYALFEDIDASLAVSSEGVLVGCHDALIYHHRFPSGRPNPYSFAAISVLNRAYIFAKQGHRAGLPPDEMRDLERRTRRFARLRQLRSLALLRRPEGQADYRGTRDALAAIGAIFAARPEDLPAAYGAVRIRLGLES